ncbi:hypothetical protein HUJ05_005435 [Dendroctonus ponderosae]|nr:hypothetical protein HUJ05_005435 [Dendroctonus ponderosae]
MCQINIGCVEQTTSEVVNHSWVRNVLPGVEWSYQSEVVPQRYRSRKRRSGLGPPESDFKIVEPPQEPTQLIHVKYVRLEKHEPVNRPISMKKEGIQTRKRRPKSATAGHNGSAMSPMPQRISVEWSYQSEVVPQRYRSRKRRSGLGPPESDFKIVEPPQEPTQLIHVKYVRLEKHEPVNRPISMKKEGIQTRKRRPKSATAGHNGSAMSPMPQRIILYGVFADI